VTSFSTRLSGRLLTIERQVSGVFEPGYRQVELAIHGVDSAALAVDGGRSLSGAGYDEPARTMRLFALPAALYTIEIDSHHTVC
jgi:hypothetical protein